MPKNIVLRISFECPLNPNCQLLVSTRLIKQAFTIENLNIQGKKYVN